MVEEKPVEGPPVTSTKASLRGAPVSQAVIVPLSVPCAGAVVPANLKAPIFVFQAKPVVGMVL